MAQLFEAMAGLMKNILALLIVETKKGLPPTVYTDCAPEQKYMAETMPKVETVQSW